MSTMTTEEREKRQAVKAAERHRTSIYEVGHAVVDLLRCLECQREVDEFTAIAERWGFWSDGSGELLPFCSECARRERARARLVQLRYAAGEEGDAA